MGNMRVLDYRTGKILDRFFARGTGLYAIVDEKEMLVGVVEDQMAYETVMTGRKVRVGNVLDEIKLAGTSDFRKRRNEI